MYYHRAGASLFLAKLPPVFTALVFSGTLQRWGLKEDDPTIPQSRRYLAVPFLGKDVPSNSSEFANPEVIIGLTILAYLHEGLRLSDVGKLVRNCKESLLRELGPAEHRPTHVLYSSWTRNAVFAQHAASGEVVADAATDDGLELMPLQFVRADDEDELAQVHALLRHYTPAAMHFLQQLVFPALMKHQSSKITASGADLGAFYLRARSHRCCVVTTSASVMVWLELQEARCCLTSGWASLGHPLTFSQPSWVDACTSRALRHRLVRQLCLDSACLPLGLLGGTVLVVLLFCSERAVISTICWPHNPQKLDPQRLALLGRKRASQLSLGILVFGLQR